jgi:hypothetical protein
MAPRVWISEIRATRWVERKIRVKHQLSLAQVKAAALFFNARSSKWHDHPKYGRRLLVTGEVDGVGLVLVTLHPVNVDEGVYKLGTARRKNAIRKKRRKRRQRR